MHSKPSSFLSVGSKCAVEIMQMKIRKTRRTLVWWNLTFINTNFLLSLVLRLTRRPSWLSQLTLLLIVLSSSGNGDLWPLTSSTILCDIVNSVPGDLSLTCTNFHTNVSYLHTGDPVLAACFCILALSCFMCTLAEKSPVDLRTPRLDHWCRRFRKIVHLGTHWTV